MFQIDKIINTYVHNTSTYEQVRDKLDIEMNKGLSKKDNCNSTVKMLLTYVQSLPDGKGDFILQCELFHM